MSEHWRPVPGYEGRYEVSDLGRVRSLDRIVNGAPGQPDYLKAGRVLRPGKHRQGYLLVSLYGATGRRTHKVHRLVLMAFEGDRPGLDARHADDDPRDNRLSKLSWGTRADNMRDAVRNGRNPSTRRQACPRGHLLAWPNLRRGEWERTGYRQCRACARERDRARRAGRPFTDAGADAAYVEIRGES